MFNFFKKKKTVLPDFNAIETSPIKDKYFCRTMEWDWLNDKMIHVFDHKHSRMITMDPWPQQVFLDADGQKTIKEYIYWMAGLYPPETIPESLDQDILQVINNLMEDGGLLELKENKTELRHYIKVPRSEQNRERALREMKEDGLIE